MDKKKLQPLVLNVLRREGQTHLHAIAYEIKHLAPEYERHDILKLQEIIWELLVQGVLAPGKNSLNLNLPFVHVTEYGARCLEDDALVLHDPDGYMERLKETVGNPLDVVVQESVREGLLAFLAGRYVAAMVMLGMAAERCLDLLIAAYANAIADQSRRDAFDRTVKETARSIKGRFDVLRGELQALFLSPGLKEVLDVQFPGLLTVVRYTRDDAGHPTVQTIDRDTAHASLLLFPQYCKRVYELVEHFRENQA